MTLPHPKSSKFRRFISLLRSFLYYPYSISSNHVGMLKVACKLGCSLLNLRINETTFDHNPHYRFISESEQKASLSRIVVVYKTFVRSYETGIKHQNTKLQTLVLPNPQSFKRGTCLDVMFYAYNMRVRLETVELRQVKL